MAKSRKIRGTLRRRAWCDRRDVIPPARWARAGHYNANGIVYKKSFVREQIEILPYQRFDRLARHPNNLFAMCQWQSRAISSVED